MFITPKGHFPVFPLFWLATKDAAHGHGRPTKWGASTSPTYLFIVCRRIYPPLHSEGSSSRLKTGEYCESTLSVSPSVALFAYHVAWKDEVVAA
jgi:hypothetical protein